jgi:hypothetical protein
MCIMFLKRADQGFPADEVLKIGWDDNRDGASYSWLDMETKEWVTIKGLMSWTAFKERFDADRELYNLDDKEVVVHFRVGTTGGITGGATHPFPAEEQEGLTVNTLEYRSNGVLFHNGTIGKSNKEYSDSQIGVMKYAWPLIPLIFENDKEPDEQLLVVLRKCLDGKVSRWCICYKEHVITFGKWHKQKETGVIFSNKRFKLDETRFNNKNNYLNYDWNKCKFDEHLKVEYLKEDLALASAWMDADNNWSWEAWNQYYKVDDEPFEEEKDTIKVYNDDGSLAFEIAPENTPNKRLCYDCKRELRDKDLTLYGCCPGCGAQVREYNCANCDKSFSVDFIYDWHAEGIVDYAVCTACGNAWGYTADGGNKVAIGTVDNRGDFYPIGCGNGYEKKEINDAA